MTVVRLQSEVLVISKIASGGKDLEVKFGNFLEEHFIANFGSANSTP